MKDVGEYKARLEERLGELDARMHRIEDQLDDPVSQDWEERAVEREDSEVLEDLGQAGIKETEQIRAALARIERGEFGICVRCGETISPERLEIVPHTALCRTCASGASR